MRQYASRGTIVHKLIEIFLTDGKWVEPDDVPELKEDIAILMGGSRNLTVADCSYKAFFEKYRPDIVVGTLEKQVVNEEHAYAGRCDMIGLWKGKPAIFDFKTGATSDFRQPAAYAACRDGNVKNLIICPVGPCDNKSGYFQPKISTDVKGEFQAFLKARAKFRHRFGV